MRQGVIYRATNLINGKCYIGKTICKLTKRKREHIYSSRHLKEKKECLDIKNDDVYFHRAINKYDIENFKWEIIFECDDELILGIMETMKIIVNHSHVSENGYNLTWGNDGTYGYNHTEETKKKISNKLFEFYLTEKGKELRLKIKGHSVSEEGRQKISEVHKDKIVSEEIRKKLSEAKKGHSVSKAQIQKHKATCLKKRLEREANKPPVISPSPKWLITYPDGSTIQVVSLSKFCKDNGFPRQGLHNLTRGRGNTYKGYKCEKM